MSSRLMIFISSWPIWTFWPTSTVRLLTMPLTGATSRVYCRLSSGLFEFGFLLLGLGLRGLGARAHCGQSVAERSGRSASWPPPARVWPAPATTCCSAADAAGPGRGHSGGARLRRRDCLVVLLLRNFLLVDQLLVAPQIVLRLDVIGFGLLQLRPRGFQLLARHRNSGACALHFGLRRRTPGCRCSPR